MHFDTLSVSNLIFVLNNLKVSNQFKCQATKVILREKIIVNAMKRNGFLEIFNQENLIKILNSQ